jgi:hypothetical protein
MSARAALVERAQLQAGETVVVMVRRAGRAGSRFNSQGICAREKPSAQDGVDVVLDYLWGRERETVIVAIAKAVEDARP